MISPVKKAVTTPNNSIPTSANITHNLSSEAVTKCKRATLDSSCSIIEIQSMPSNPALRIKHISFHF